MKEFKHIRIEEVRNGWIVYEYNGQAHMGGVERPMNVFNKIEDLNIFIKEYYTGEDEKDGQYDGKI